MKKWMWIMVAVPFLLGFQGKKADFSGTWALDIKKSVNLPREFKTVDSMVLNVRQAGDSLVVLATMKGQGQTVPFPPFIYLLNGKETHRVDTARKSERWILSRWGKDGTSASMESRAKFTPPGKPVVELKQHDEWKKTDASTLVVTVTQKVGGTDSTHTETRIYRKQK